MFLGAVGTGSGADAFLELAGAHVLADSPFGCKQTPLDSGYSETFNRDNVHLVDVKSNPIEAITPAGVRLADGTKYEFDPIVYATEGPSSTWSSSGGSSPTCALGAPR